MDSLKIHQKVVHGLNFTPKMVEEAIRNNRMLVLDMDFSQKCNLNCYYCDRTFDRKSVEKHLTTLEEKKKIIKEAKELGTWALGIVGAGEPMLDPDFYELIDFITNLDIVPLVYASGSEIKSLEDAKKLEELKVSIMLKYNTEPEKEIDKIVGKKNHGEQMKKVLKWLIESGFNKSSPTRLGLSVVITKLNEKERENFYNLYKWCRKNNIYLHGQSLIPKGMGNNVKLLLHKEEALKVLNETCKIDKEFFDINYEVVPPITSGFRCRKINVGLFVNIFGEVWDCNGSGRKLGNIREKSLKEIWNSDLAKQIRKDLQEGKCHLREYWWKKEKNETEKI